MDTKRLKRPFMSSCAGILGVRVRQEIQVDGVPISVCMKSMDVLEASSGIVADGFVVWIKDALGPLYTDWCIEQV